MNELQIRLTADIANLQSALKQAKKALKDFENTTTQESEKSNDSFERKIGLIEKLEAEAKVLRVLLRQATDETQIERYNQELQETQKQLTRLNLIGRSSINNINQGLANGTGVAIEFNRVIQDAPFGIIGIGNNIQQLAGNFSNLRAQAGSTGAALKAAFTSLVSPVNLGLLAISALTAGFTAYQMGAFDSIFATEEATQSLKDLASELKSASANSFVEQTRVNALREVIEDETRARDERLAAVKRLQDSYPSIFKNADTEKLLNGQLAESYDLLSKSILQRAKVSIAEQELPNLVKQKEIIDQQVTAIQEQIRQEEALQATRSKRARITQIESDFDAGVRQLFELNNQLKEVQNTQKALDINIKGFSQSIIDYSQQFDGLSTSLDGVAESTTKVVDEFTDVQWQQAQENLLAFGRALNRLTVADGQGTSDIGDLISQQLDKAGPPIQELAAELQNVSIQTQDYTTQILGAFTDLGTGIVASLNISNQGLRGFLTTLVSATPRIIQAVMAQAKASEAAANIANKGNIKQAAGNTVVTSTNAAKALGPIGLALLPVFIAGGLALINGAFSKIGGGASVGSGGGSASIGSSFSNRPASVGQLVSPQRGTASFTGFDGGGFGTMSIDVNFRGVLQGDDIALVVDQAIIKRGNR